MLPARCVVAALCLVMLPALAAGNRYRVDVIVFGDGARRAIAPAGTPDAEEAPATAALPEPTEPARAVSADEAAALQREGIQVLDESSFALQTEWQKLKHSARFRPLAHLSWVQNGALERGGPSVRFHVNDHVVGSVDGSFLLNGGALLHLTAHVSEPPAPGETGSEGNRLDESRRLRLDELHYLDSPHLGVLTRVSRAD